MEFSEYIVEFNKIMKKKQPIMEKRTVADYLYAFAELPPLLRETKKCAIGSSALREFGNMEFQSRNYEEAAIQYTYSISKAPPYSKCGALGYANRSAALYCLGSFEECITDIDRALDLPYPDDLKPKVISRRQSALECLGITRGSRATKENNDPLIDNKPDLASGDNPKLSNASCGIDMICDAKNGTKLVAKTRLNSGDVLVVEKPFITVPAIETDPTFCHHCLKKTFCLIPCNACTYEVYCSEKCRTEAYENYHRTECRIQYTFIATYDSSLSIDRQLMVGLVRCLTILTKQGARLDALFRDFEEIEKNSDAVTLAFTGERSMGNLSKAFLGSSFGKNVKFGDSMFEEIYVVVMLKNYTNFFETNRDVVKLANLMHKFKAAYLRNCITIPYLGPLNANVYGTYLLTGVAGHACYNNNTITYHDKEGRIILRASEPMKPGDQITGNYPPSQIQTPREIRTTSDTIVKVEMICSKCQVTAVHHFQKQPFVKLDKQLRRKLYRNPYDVKLLWKLLSIVQENQDDPSSVPVQTVKLLLTDAYEGREDRKKSEFSFRMLGF